MSAPTPISVSNPAVSNTPKLASRAAGRITDFIRVQLVVSPHQKNHQNQSRLGDPIRPNEGQQGARGRAQVVVDQQSQSQHQKNSWQFDAISSVIKQNCREKQTTKCHQVEGYVIVHKDGCCIPLVLAC